MRKATASMLASTDEDDEDNEDQPPMESTDGGINRWLTTTPTPTATNITNTTNTRAPKVSTPVVPRLDRHETRTTTGRTDGSNKQGRMTTMGMTETIPPATGTLDRKTSQASQKACLYNKNNQHKTREA
jgi:hypothetical protein